MADSGKPTGSADAATQAATGEARVLGTDQDQSSTGDAAVAALQGNRPADDDAQFTR